MKNIIKNFVFRGLVACGFGPIVLAVIYLILKQNNVIDILTVNQVCIGIFSISVLAFVSGGMNAIYQIERLPLMFAILIHGVVLYMTYLGTYLLNDWLALGTTPILVFTVIFIVGYLIIWAIIYFSVRTSTSKVNETLKIKQENQ